MWAGNTLRGEETECRRETGSVRCRGEEETYQEIQREREREDCAYNSVIVLTVDSRITMERWEERDGMG